MMCFFFCSSLVCRGVDHIVVYYRSRLSLSIRLDVCISAIAFTCKYHSLGAFIITFSILFFFFGAMFTIHSIRADKCFGRSHIRQNNETHSYFWCLAAIAVVRRTKLHQITPNSSRKHPIIWLLFLLHASVIC